MAPPPAAPGQQPRISVVVASNRESTLLEACLQSLVNQAAAANAELIVARAPQPGDELLRNRYATVRFVDAPGKSDIPHLRGLGLGASSGDVALLTEDHCVAGERWVQTLREAIADVDVAGGAMGNAKTARAIDWAAYFAEYGFFSGARPGAGDAAPLLTAANVGYRGRWIRNVSSWYLAGQWENVAHDRIRDAGGRLRFVPEARIDQNRSYRFTPFCRDRYEHGRDYARARMTEAQGTRRGLRILGCLALPIVLIGRVARAAAPMNPRAFLRAAPLTLCFLSAWSIGELAGYWSAPSPTGAAR